MFNETIATPLDLRGPRDIAQSREAEGGQWACAHQVLFHWPLVFKVHPY